MPAPFDPDRPECAASADKQIASAQLITTAQDALSRAIEETRGAFIAKLKTHRDALAQYHAETLAGATPVPQIVEGAKLATHRVAGVAPMFGWPDLGTAARAADADLAAPKSRLSEPALARLAALITQIDCVILQNGDTEATGA